MFRTMWAYSALNPQGQVALLLQAIGLAVPTYRLRNRLSQFIVRHHRDLESLGHINTGNSHVKSRGGEHSDEVSP